MMMVVKQWVWSFARDLDAGDAFRVIPFTGGSGAVRSGSGGGDVAGVTGAVGGGQGSAWCSDARWLSPSSFSSLFLLRAAFSFFVVSFC
jgi:hypothetical protein